MLLPLAAATVPWPRAPAGLGLVQLLACELLSLLPSAWYARSPPPLACLLTSPLDCTASHRLPPQVRPHRSRTRRRPPAGWGRRGHQARALLWSLPGEPHGARSPCTIPGVREQAGCCSARWLEAGSLLTHGFAVVAASSPLAPHTCRFLQRFPEGQPVEVGLALAAAGVGYDQDWAASRFVTATQAVFCLATVNAALRRHGHSRLAVVELQEPIHGSTVATVSAYYLAPEGWSEQQRQQWQRAQQQRLADERAAAVAAAFRALTGSLEAHGGYQVMRSLKPAIRAVAGCARRFAAMRGSSVLLYTGQLRCGGQLMCSRLPTCRTPFPDPRSWSAPDLQQKISQLAAGQLLPLGSSQLVAFRGPIGLKSYVAQDAQTARVALRELAAAAAATAAGMQQSAARRKEASRAALQQLDSTRGTKGGSSTGPRSQTEKAQKTRKRRAAHEHREGRRAAAAAAEAVAAKEKEGAEAAAKRQKRDDRQRRRGG